MAQKIDIKESDQRILVQAKQIKNSNKTGRYTPEEQRILNQANRIVHNHNKFAELDETLDKLVAKISKKSKEIWEQAKPKAKALGKKAWEGTKSGSKKVFAKTKKVVAKQANKATTKSASSIGGFLKRIGTNMMDWANKRKKS